MKYLKIILVSFVVASLINVIALYILQLCNIIGTADTDMKNLPYGLAVGFNLILAISTLTILINIKASVKARSVLSVLSFFLLPLMVTLFISLSLDEEGTCVIFSSLPYLAMLLVFYVRLT